MSKVTNFYQNEINEYLAVKIKTPFGVRPLTSRSNLISALLKDIILVVSV